MCALDWAARVRFVGGGFESAADGPRSGTRSGEASAGVPVHAAIIADPGPRPPFLPPPTFRDHAADRVFQGRIAASRMPELPDLTIYLEHLDRRITGERLEDIRLASPFVLRTVSPPVEEVRGRAVTAFRRLAKQIVFELEDEYFIVIHC